MGSIEMRTHFWDNAEIVGDTLEMTHEEWLTERRKGVGASDASTVVGINPWSSEFALYLEKRGEYVPEEPGEAAEWGHLLEPVVLDRFRTRIQYEVPGLIVEPYKMMLRSKARPWQLANLDGICLLGDVAGVVEVKTAGGRGWFDRWANGVPDHYILQVQHQMAVTGFDYAYVVALLGGNKLEWWRIERDQGQIETLTNIEAEFWARVQDGNPPAVDGAQSTADALKALYPTATPDSIVELPSEAADCLFVLADANAAIRDAEATKKAAENQLRLMMGDNETGFLEGVEFPVVTFKTQTRKETVQAASTFRVLRPSMKALQMETGNL
jgi:putative phage-type endonuclease